MPKRWLLVPALTAFTCLYCGAFPAPARAATFTGNIVDLKDNPINLAITVLAFGTDADGQRLDIAGFQSGQVVTNGKFTVPVTDSRIKAVTIILFRPGLQPAALTNVRNNADQTVDVVMPVDETYVEPPPLCACPPPCCQPAHGKCGLFGRLFGR